MISEIEHQIIKATCSKTLQKVIQKNKFGLADFDLLYLAYKYAPDYDTRLDFLKLIESNTKDVAIKEFAIKYILFETEKLNRFIEPEEDCIYEVKIKETPNSWEERYLAKTFNGALKKAEYFCKYYDRKMDINSRFEIVKRKVVDETKIEDFNEDWHGEATYNGNFALINVSYEYSKNELLFSNECDFEGRDCKDCNELCLTNKIPKLPQFLKNLDVICYNDYYGIKQYAVIFVFNADNADSDDCAYCIPLDKERICNKIIRSRKAFDEKIILGLHDHIEYPRIDIIQVTDLPKDAEKAYQTLIRLNERFNIT